MDDLRSSIVERLRSDSNRKLKPARNGGFEFRCPSPGHPDNKASAWIGEGGWKCLGCGAKGNLRDLAQLIGLPVASSNGYSLEEYADAKGFSAPRLRGWGLSTEIVNGSSVLAIPYLDQEGKLLRRRFRGARSRRWWEGRNLPIHPYGLERLVDVGPGDPILVVEGESDCHAAWLGGFNAFGLPGATTWRSEWKKHLEGLDIYVWEEPDQGGASFSRSLAGDFPDAKLIQSADAKDVAELYASAGSEFGTKLRALMAAALPIGTQAPPIAFDSILAPSLDRMAADKMRGVDATPTMLSSWNRACRGRGGGVGIGRGSHVVVGARTGTGKSIVAANLAVAAVDLTP